MQISTEFGEIFELIRYLMKVSRWRKKFATSSESVNNEVKDG